MLFGVADFERILFFLLAYFLLEAVACEEPVTICNYYAATVFFWTHFVLFRSLQSVVSSAELCDQFVYIALPCHVTQDTC